MLQLQEGSGDHEKEGRVRGSSVQSGHRVSECPVKERICRRCRRPGHEVVASRVLVMMISVRVGKGLYASPTMHTVR